MSADKYFTRDNLDDCLTMLGKEFRKRNGKTMPAEIILIGGAAVLLNYGFRAANVLSNNHLDELYELYREEEQANREALVQFEKDYPEVTTEENVKDIIKHLKARRSVNSQVDQISQ